MAEINKRYSKFINEELKTETETKTEIKTTLLDQMGRDLTKLAKDGKFDPVIGREKEMDEVIAILARRRKNNPVLIGNPGIGKTAIVEGIAQMIADEKCPDNLIGKRIIEVDLSTIMSGTSLQGDLEKKVKRILLELEHNPDVILFIDELHMLVDSNKPIDVSNMFKPALARGEMRCIGATTNKEYRIIEKDGALERRFQKVQVDEPSMSETIEILNRIKGGYEKFHNVKYTDDAITACVKLAGKYITDRYFPDKAIDLLDEVGARLRVRQTVSKEVKELERELHNLREEKMRLVNNQKYEESAKLRVREVQIVKRLETLTKTENAVEVTKKDVESIMSRKIDIPELKSDDVDDMNKYINLESALKMEIVGQDDAVKRVSKSLRRNVAGLKDPNRPRGVFLFLGSTGTGKCHGRGTKIMMFDGSVKNVEDVIEGDLLMGDDSTPRRVLSLASGRDKMYNIKYKNGSFTCNSEHVLSLKKTGTYEIVNIPLNEYLSKNKTFKHTHKLWKSKIDFDEKNVKRIQKKSVDLYGFEVEYIGEDEYFGFDIDGNHLYMLGDFTVTHNTYTVKTLAKHVFGSESDIIRVDMSEYGEKHNVARLIGCFHPDTMIQMSSGANKAIVNVNIGDYVITHNGNKKKVIDKYEYDNTDGYLDSYKISNRNIKLECTPQHEILAIKPTFYNKRVDKNSYNIENAKFYHSHELNVGDIVMYPKSIELDEGDKNVIDIIKYLPEGYKYKFDDNYIWHNLNEVKINRYIKLDKYFARLGGYYISEGGCNTNRKSIKFTFNISETDYIDETIFLIRKIFSQDINIDVQSDKNRTNLVITSRIINLLLSDLFGRTCYDKKIPNIFSTNDELFSNILETMIYGDGSKTIDKKCTYTTVSNTLAYQLNSFLRKFGYSTQFNRIDAYVDKRGYQCSVIYKIILTGDNNISKLNNFLPNFKFKNSDVVPKNIQRHQYQDDKYFYYTIISKDRVGYDGKVYDLSIEGDSTYIANGICVHNSPPGYVGYGEGGQLTEKVRRNPYSIILFDELEKAHPSVLNVLLQVFEDGHLTDGEGRKVDFKNTIIIMTSNIGSRAAATVAAPIGFGNKAAIQEEKTKDIIKNELKERLAPEFLNRIDDIIIFASLTKDNIYNIVDVEVNKLKKRLKDMGYDLEISDSMRQLLADKGYDPSLGARPLKRTIVQYIEDPISEELLRKTLTDKISMDYDKKTDKVLINGNPIIERIVKSWNGFNRLKG